MATQKTPMTCPKCGVAMNHHASKRIEPRSREEASRADAALGGRLEEAHCCPRCGMGAARSEAEALLSPDR